MRSCRARRCAFTSRPARVWTAEYEEIAAYGHNSAGIVARSRKPAAATVATLHTTPLDYARFMIAIMKGEPLQPQVPIDEACYSRPGFLALGREQRRVSELRHRLCHGDGVAVFTNSGNGFSIMPEIVSAAIGGPHPAFAWMGYEGYRSPSRLLLRDIIAHGTHSALTNPAANSRSG